MTSRTVLRPTTRSDLYICARCFIRARNGIPTISKRGISLKYLAKVAEAEKDWEAKAVLTRAGERQSMLSILEERGYVNQIAGKRSNLDSLMTNKRLGAYIGIDPTAPSLHIGHMIPLMSLFWMYVHGFHTLTLLGGATSKIGDPTGRITDRDKIHRKERTENMIRMHYQMKKIWENVEHYGKKHGYHWEWAWKRGLVNNSAWMNKLNVIEMLQAIGPGMRMGTMLSRDTVKNKMSSSDGMSFAEFSYPVLQAWDWWHMYNTQNIQLQIGGSDQFGNIVAGVDAINYLRANYHDPVTREAVDIDNPLLSPTGFTTTLLTNSQGEKIGKSSGNAVWLDGDMTTPFDLYGYWLRQPDGDLERYLKLFTFLPIQTIKDAVTEHMKDPKKRMGQHLLAREFVELIHGSQVAQDAETQHRLLFSKAPTSLPDNKTSPMLYGDVSKPFTKESSAPTLNLAGPSPTPTLELPRSIIDSKSIGQLLYAAGLATSRSEGHRLASSGGAYIGGLANVKNKLPMNDGAMSWVPIRIWDPKETTKFIVNDLLTLRKGKNAIKIIRLVSDQEWIKSGKRYPGQGQTPLLSEEVADPKWPREKVLTKLSKGDGHSWSTNDLNDFKGNKPKNPHTSKIESLPTSYEWMQWEGQKEPVKSKEPTLPEWEKRRLKKLEYKMVEKEANKQLQLRWESLPDTKVDRKSATGRAYPLLSRRRRRA